VDEEIAGSSFDEPQGVSATTLEFSLLAKAQLIFRVSQKEDRGGS
jgi:hypothetical protein